ncbi:NUDIX domain-containing protein [Actinomadura sp. DC4]|uniref:NUDIX domain-containing protein n=1 Tax=Actinomadura sp. DC4 TaxID=3055069 RepID=UPI0025B1BDC2|nr:NUDIX domain-containing protein [Actinomadura sp. DC4]MDN3356881.1 NUDIX domain-containing protein [Actinomadura sp. DC4]
MGDGDGWADCDAGHRHWGRYGAAGVLLYCMDSEPYVLLQKRSRLSIGGGTWGVLGGARHSHEGPIEGALREASEESTLDPSTVRVHWRSAEDHGGWSYETVIGSVPSRVGVRPQSFESAAVAWVSAREVDRKKLFPPFAESWKRLRESLYRVVLVVDTANAMGSRADGWWRDRHGAAERLRDEIAAVSGFTGLPDAIADVCYPSIVMVTEGAARGVSSADGVEVVAAPGSGDDTIVELAASQAVDERRLVVTADRELRARCEAAGATVIGPRWLLDTLRQARPA